MKRTGLFFRYTVPLAALILHAAAGYAQPDAPATEALSLADVMRLAREVSPRLALERQTIAGAEANRISAGVYPNPTVNYGRFRPHGGQATLFDGSRQEQTTVDVPLLIAGQRMARVEKAERDIDAARARVVAGATSLAAEAGAAFVTLQAAQEKAALLARTGEELARLRGIVAGRAELGAASRYDVTRLEVEVGSFVARLDDAKADIADRAGMLAALLGLPQLRPRASGTLAPLTLDTAVAGNNKAAAGPAVAAALREEEAAQSNVELAHRERWPVPSVSVGRSWTSNPHGAATFMGLSVEIPILDTRRGPVAKAEAEATAAKLRRELAQAETAAHLERYAGIITSRQAALQRFDAEAGARLPAMKEMAEQAYRLGRGSIFELLDATRSRHDLQQTRIELLASLVEAQLRFIATSGSLDRRFGATEPVKP